VNFQHDVFISYNQADLAWAQAVHEGLVADAGPGALPPFFAPDSLRAGEGWEQHVEQALASSRHLVVLWSDAARDSPWVTRELFTFNALARPVQDPSRRLLFVNLQGASPLFTQLQQVNVAAVQQSYLSGQPAPAADMARLRLKLRQGLDPLMRPLAVPLAILAMTRGELDALPADRRARIEEDLRVRLPRLAPQYGERRDQWRPFGRDLPVADVLAQAAQRVDEVIAGRSCAWVEPGADFWISKTAAKAWIDKTFSTGELSLLLIDPASLSHPDVFERLMLFQHSLASPTTVIAALTPFGTPRRLQGLKAALRERAMPYFDDFLLPAVPPQRRVVAQCSLNAADADDIGRQLLHAAAHLGGNEPAPVARSPFLQHGGGR